MIKDSHRQQSLIRTQIAPPASASGLRAASDAATGFRRVPCMAVGTDGGGDSDAHALRQQATGGGGSNGVPCMPRQTTVGLLPPEDLHFLAVGDVWARPPILAQ